jgi:hypothetical protein
MAVNTTTFESTLQTKLNDTTLAAKEMLLLGKALESTVGSIAVSDINTAGATKVSEINTVATNTFKTVGGASILGSGDIATLPSQSGASGKVLKSDGTNATWDTDTAGKVLQVAALTHSTRVALSLSANYWDSFGTITKISATSKLVVSGTFSGQAEHSGSCGVGIRINTLYRYGNYTYATTTNSKNYAINADFGAMAAGVHTVYWGWKTGNGGSTDRPFAVFNPNSTDDSRQQQTTSVIIVTEVEA